MFSPEVVFVSSLQRCSIKLWPLGKIKNILMDSTVIYDFKAIQCR